MKPNYLIILVLAALGIGGFVWFQGQTDDTGMQAEPAREAAPQESGGAEIAAPAAVDTAVEAAKPAPQNATEEAGKVLNDIEEAVENTAEQATEALQDAAQTAEDRFEQARDTIRPADEGATPDTAPQAAAPETAAELLSPEGFDADRIVALIDAADLPDARKDRLRRAIRNAANTPALMDQALARVRLALGM